MNKNYLIKEYKIKSVSQIAKENKIPLSNLYRLFDKYNIIRRTQKEAGKLRTILHTCLDCGRKVSRKEYKRCRQCESKRTHKDYYCITCGNKISNSNGLYGKKQCIFCANKGKNNPMFGRKRFYSVHHIDLNHNNNKKTNLLKIPQNIHSSLHHRAYNYLVELGLIKDYIRWFFKVYTNK